jgi:hypothetical protein
MEIEGSIKEIFQTQSFDSGFTKREFVVTTKEQYPQDIKLELIKDRCDLVDAYKKGDQVKVQFNLRGNEYNGKYFVNLQAWRIEAFTAGAKASAGSGASASSADPFADAGFPSEPVFDSNNNAGGGDDNDDLPF